MYGQAGLSRRTNIGRQRAVSTSLPAPVGGLNERDSLAEMRPDQASILENWFPERGDVHVRKGYESYATGLGAAVESLMTYNSPTANELYGAADDEIFDVSSSGAVGAAVVGSLTNAQWQHINFGTSGGHFLLCVNAADTGRQYNGTTWSTWTVTGVNTNTIIHLHSHKQRVFMIPENSTSFWYLAVNAITGTASEYPLYSDFLLGGYLMAMGSLTRDGGDGSDDLAVFISSEGEVLTFYGADPGTAADWFRVGRYRIGRPIGRRCMMQVGADLVVITEDGVVPLSRVLPSGRSDPGQYLTDQISEGFNLAVRNNGTNWGWQPLLYPQGHMGIINVPTSSTEAFQYVVNTATGAWTKFTGMDARCWAIYSNDLYFGGNSGVVYKADTGEDDNGSFINTDCRTAFNYFGAPVQLKQFRQVRPQLLSIGDVNPSLALNVDYDGTQPTTSPGLITATGATWDSAVWDESDWGASEQPVSSWAGVTGMGYAAALRIRTSTKVQGCRWFATDWVWEPAGMI